MACHRSIPWYATGAPHGTPQEHLVVCHRSTSWYATGEHHGMPPENVVCVLYEKLLTGGGILTLFP